jgi:hypothetical protein
VTRGIAVGAAALAITLVVAESSQACSCVPPRPRQQLKQADGAFVGRLLAVRGGDPADYVYRVGRVSKGGPGLRRGRRVKVRSPSYSASCGLPDARGRLYGLFLTRRDGRWNSNLCSVVAPADMPDAGASRSRRSRAGSPGSGACG